MRAQSIPSPLPRPSAKGVVDHPKICTGPPPAPLCRPCIRDRLLGRFSFLALRDVRVVVRWGHADALELLHPDADFRDTAVVPQLRIAAAGHRLQPLLLSRAVQFPPPLSSPTSSRHLLS